MMKKYTKLITVIILAVVLAALALFKNSHKNYSYDFSNQEISGDENKSLLSYFQTAQTLRGPQDEKTSATFLAVGDIMLSRNVAAAIKTSGNVNLPFSKMSEILESTDFNFGNLETPVAEKNPTIGGHSLVFNAPQEYVRPLKTYNFEVLSLANNHALDKGPGGLNFTKTFLDRYGITYAGAGDNLEQAWLPAIVKAKGIAICFISASYASINDNGKTTNNYVARIEDLDRLKSAILYAKDGHPSAGRAACDFTVVTMHAGVEYTRTPNAAQTKFARAAIDYGADVVIGAHPHWIQTIEKYCPSVPPPLPLGEDAPMQRGAGEGSANCPNPKYIFYSLGNFIFDQPFSRDTSEGLALKIQLSKKQESNLQGSLTPAKLDSIELIPIIITNSQPRPATADETKKILQKIGQTENILK